VTIEIEEITTVRLKKYARIPIAFTVKSVLRVEARDSGLAGLALEEEAVEPSYVKDYDAYEDGGPLGWPKRFDVRNWGFFLALEGSHPVGGAAVAFDTPGVHMLAGRRDLAVLWDIRVDPDLRRSGIGTRLFDFAADWARVRGCRQLKIETQNVNVPACRFYSKQGCDLGEIDRYAYAHHPDVAREAMLIWYLNL
jgi:GNAT superfamily N-acetyltransferase